MGQQPGSFNSSAILGVRDKGGVKKYSNQSLFLLLFLGLGYGSKSMPIQSQMSGGSQQSAVAGGSHQFPVRQSPDSRLVGLWMKITQESQFNFVTTYTQKFRYLKLIKIYYDAITMFTSQNMFWGGQSNWRFKGYVPYIPIKARKHPPIEKSTIESNILTRIVYISHNINVISTS